MIRKALVLALLVGGLGLLVAFTRNQLTWQAVIEREAELQRWLMLRPWLGVLTGFGVYVIVSLIPGTTGKAIVVGWLFGFWWGLLIVNVGLTAAAMLSFLLSRYLFSDAIESRLGPRMIRLSTKIRYEGAGYLFTARVLHVPFSLTNYVVGATRLPFLGFWWATQLGILPGNILYVYAGAQAPSLLEIQEQGIASLLTPGLLSAFVAVSVLPLLLHWVVRRMMERRSRGD